MVSHARQSFKCLLWLCFMLQTGIASAEPELQASVDRNQIYATDTINLRVVGNFEMEMSFGGILNFGRNQVGAPDTTALQQDFEILDQQQSYNMQSINGQTTSQITWNYTLAPKREGILQIPAIEYNGTQSDPIAITVKAGSAPRNAENPPAVFLEVDVDKESAYVQEQIVYTLRLYAADHLASGDLSDPSPVDAIVESMGDTKKFFRMAYNQRYEVRERKYLIFPQKSGPLTIDAQSFTGILIDTRSRRRQRVREVSDALTVDVKSPPASFSGSLWLPATSLHLSETWEQDPDTLKVGDSVTRMIEIQSLGLLGSALPPITTPNIDGLKVYPDQPEVESVEHKSGVQSRRLETTALVAVSPGTITLPEIRIPWWDTVNDVERVAVLPSRQLEVKPAAGGSDPASPQVSGKPSTSEFTAGANNEPSASAVNQNGDNQFETDTADLQGANQQVSGANLHFWYTLCGLLVIGWLTSSYWFWRQLRAKKTEGPQRIQPGTGDDTYKALKAAIRQDDMDMPRLLVRWAAEYFNEPNIRSIQDLSRIDTVLAQQAKAFEASRYAPQQNVGSASPPYDQKALLACLENLLKAGKQKRHDDSQALMPFYP